jgi:hypothetical protein
MEVQEAINNFSEKDNDYENCAKLVEELEAVGYTCDYGLDASPYDLKQI